VPSSAGAASNGVGDNYMTNPAIDGRVQSELERRAYEDLPYSSRWFAPWLRARLVEHWYGRHFWRDLDREDFGLLRRAIHPNLGLVADIVALLLTGSENLTVIAWALETRRPLDDVVAILTVLDVNTRRFPPFPSLVAATPPNLRVLRPASP
jgi:hypothetical protein